MFKNVLKSTLLSILSLFLVLGSFTMAVSAEDGDTVIGFQDPTYAARTVLYLKDPNSSGYLVVNPITTPDGKAIYCVDEAWNTPYNSDAAAGSGSVKLEGLGLTGIIREDIYQALESGYLYYPNSSGLNDGTAFFNEQKSSIEDSIDQAFGRHIDLTIEDFQVASAIALHIYGGDYTLDSIISSSPNYSEIVATSLNPAMVDNFSEDDFDIMFSEIVALIRAILNNLNDNIPEQNKNVISFTSPTQFSSPALESRLSVELPSRANSNTLSLTPTGALLLRQGSSNIVNLSEASSFTNYPFDVTDIFDSNSGISSAILKFGTVSNVVISGQGALGFASPTLELTVNPSVYNSWIKTQSDLPLENSPTIIFEEFPYIHARSFFTTNDENQDMFLTDGKYVEAKVLGYTVSPYSSEVKIKKVDDSNNPVKDVRISLSKNGTPVTKNFYNEDLNLVTDADGFITLTDLEPGTYNYKEEEAPVGYIKSTQTFSFTINDDGTVANNSQLEFTNTITRVTLTKTDLVDGTPVPGATIKIDGVNVNYTKTIETDAEGKIVLEKLEPGTYTFKETIAPAGYILNEETVTFTIGNDGRVSGKTTMTNAPKPSVTINKKVLGTNEPLEGAKFEITLPSGTVIERYTDAQGVITLDDLDKGTYSFKETEAPAGYILIAGSEPSGTFTVSASGSVTPRNTFNFTNAKKPVPEITKTDLVDGTPVPGATIEIKGTDNNYSRTFVTGEDGKLIGLEPLDPGTYTFKETIAPNGYILSEEESTFVIGTDGKVTGKVTMTNAPLQTVILKKVLKGTNEAISGIEFTLFREGLEVQKVTSDENGAIKFENLDKGNYVIQETIPSIYVDPLANVAEFSIDHQGRITGLDNTTVENEYIVAEISKADLSTSAPVPGATLEVYKVAEDLSEELIYSGITNVDGKIAIPGGLLERSGKYYFVEKNAPDGYILNSEKHNFEVDEFGEVSEIDTLSNTLNSITIKKVDALNSTLPIADVEFKLYKNNEEVTKNVLNKTLNLKTNSNGEITIEGLAPGNYVLRESKAANGYKLDNALEIALTVEANKQIETSARLVENEPTEVILQKEDAASKAKIAGVGIKLYAENGTEVTTNALGQPLNLVSNSEGKFVLRYLPVGKYTYKEVSVPKGYSINQNTFAFEIKADGTITGTTTFDNTRTHVVLSKSDFTTAAPVEGATIEIIDATGNVVFSAVTDSSGKLNIPDGTLSIGKYTFRETIAPAGYILNTESIEFEILENGAISGVTEMKNKKTEVEILKTDALTEKPVKGALIEIYDKDNNIVTKYTDSFYTNEEGKVKLVGLPVGQYTYKEIIAPSGYLVNQNTYKFEIDKYGKVTGTLEFVDMPTSLVITKVNDKTDKPVEGAEYTFFQAGKEYGKFVTNKDGQIIIDSIPTGSYTYYETKAPAGYALDSNVYSFTVSANGDKVGTFNVRDKETGMTLYKKDYTTGKALAGAKFEIYDSSKKLVASAETDANGVFQIQALEPGSYTIKEVVAPSGYVITDKEYGFTIKADGTVEGDLTVYNKLSGGQPTPTPSNVPVNTGSGNSVMIVSAIFTLALIVSIRLLKKKVNA